MIMSRMTIKTTSVFVSSILLLFFLLLPTTCGKATNTSSETGSIAFTVVWKNGDQKSAPMQMQALLDCTATGVSTVEAAVYDQENNQLAAGGNSEDSGRGTHASGEVI
jgi:hypothetical protein